MSLLILNSSDDLGDKKLDAKENLAKLKEKNQELIDAKKLPNQSELENVEKALGQRMHWSEFVQRLQKLNYDILAEDGGAPNAIALRVPWQNEDGTLTKKYVGGFYKEVLPEFSAVIVDDKGLPHREIRGWRSVLLGLMKQGILTFIEIEKEFGDAEGQRSHLWHEQLQGKKD